MAHYIFKKRVVFWESGYIGLAHRFLKKSHDGGVNVIEGHTIILAGSEPP